MPENGNGIDDKPLARVTNAQLRLELNLIRSEQHAEHMKTRLIMVILASPGVAKAIPYVLGAIGFNLGGFPWF